MKPMISEFSYGYALTRELASGVVGAIVGAPIFPSLYKEGRTGGGFDLQLPRVGAPLFLQFKLSHWMSRPRSGEWAEYGGPYYRMYLRPLRYSQQHKLLLTWQAAGNEVYYAAPLFHTADELNTAYTANRVLTDSAFFRPSDIGELPDQDEHYVSFHPTSDTAYLCSRPRSKIQSPLIGRHFTEVQLQRLRTMKREVGREFFVHLGSSFLQVLPDWAISLETRLRLAADLRQSNTVRDAALLASYLSRAYMDAELVVLAEAQDV